MRKPYIIFITMLILISISTQPAFAALEYDYRDDMLAKSKYYDSITLLNPQILNEANHFLSDIKGAAIDKIDFSKAVKVFSYTPEEFIQLLQSDDLSESLKSTGIQVWKIPVYNSNGRIAHVRIGVQPNKNGEFGFTFIEKNKSAYTKGNDFDAKSYNNLFYAFYPNDTATDYASLLSGNPVVYITDIARFGIDFLTVISLNDVKFVPFTSNKYSEIEAEKVYTTEELSVQISEMMKAEGSSAYASGGGSAGLDGFFYMYWDVLFVVLLVISFSIFFGIAYYRSKRRIK